MGLAPSQTILSTDEMGRIAPPIFEAVGRSAPNKPGDVFVIQGLLDDRLPKPHTPVPRTGIADPGFLLAIEAYQAAVMNMVPPTGRVDPGSETYYRLAARPLVDETRIATGHLGQIPPEVAEGAMESFKHWNVPASVTIAQWAVESAWGASMPPGSNNPFGIKAVPPQPAVESLTREVEEGKDVIKTQPFRKFDTIAEAFDQHGRLLASNPVYKPAMAQKDNPEAFADALTGVYATDPQYGTTLKFVMKNYGLAQYDH